MGRFLTVNGRRRKGDESGLRITRKKLMIQQPDEDIQKRYSRNANSFIALFTTSLPWSFPWKVTRMSQLPHSQRARRGNGSGLTVIRRDTLGLRLKWDGKKGVRITKKDVADDVAIPLLFH